MSRNGAGTFAIINPVLVGALRSSSEVNENCTDAGDQITNTLPLDAQADMTGQFKAVAGSTVAPGISFDTDRNVGFRRPAPDEMRWVGGGQDRLYINASGTLFHLGAMDIAGALVVDGAVTGTNDVAQLEGFASNGLARRTGTNAWTPDQGTTSIPFSRDCGATVMPIGIMGDIRIPYACTITGAAMACDPSGSCVVDIWRSTLAAYPPVVGGSLTGGNPLTITSGTSMTSALGGWTTSITAGDVLRFNLNSVASVRRIDIILQVARFA